MSLKKIDNFNEICVDNEYNILLINWSFLIKKILVYQELIKQKSNVIKIRNIYDVMLNIKNYLSLIFRISKLTSNKITFIIICFIQHVYIIDILKIKIFMSNDNFESKQIILNLDKKKWLSIIVKILSQYSTWLIAISQLNNKWKSTMSLKFRFVFALLYRSNYVTNLNCQKTKILCFYDNVLID